MSGLSFDAKGRVVAVASDGSFVVQRGETVDVYEPHGKQPRALPLGNPKDDPGHRYAISSNAQYLAFVGRNGWIELWDVKSGERRWRGNPGERIVQRFEQPLSGVAPEVPASWGAPAFVGTRQLVSHHNGGIVVWDVSSGKPTCAVQDPTITLARESFVLENETIALRCGSNSPGIANASPFIISLSQCRVTDRLQPATTQVAMAGGILATAGGDNIRVTDGRGQSVIPHGDHFVGTLALSPRGERVVWGFDAGEIRVWSRTTNRTQSLKTGRKHPFALLWDDGSTLHAIDSEGAVFAWPVPPAESGDLQNYRKIPAEERNWQQALIRLGLEDLRGAAKLVSSDPGSSAGKYRLASIYVASLGPGEDENRFAERCRKAGLDHSAVAVQSAMLDIVGDLLDAEQANLALDLYVSWLTNPASAQGPVAKRGIEIGLGVTDLLMSAQEYDLRSDLLRTMGRLWPRNSDLQSQLKELDEDEKE